MALELGLNDSDDDEEAFDAMWGDRARGEWFHSDDTGLPTRLARAVPKRNGQGLWDRPPGMLPGPPPGCSSVTWNGARCAWEAHADKQQGPPAQPHAGLGVIRAEHFCACWNDAVAYVEKNRDLGRYLIEEECEFPPECGGMCRGIKGPVDQFVKRGLKRKTLDPDVCSVCHIPASFELTREGCEILDDHIRWNPGNQPGADAAKVDRTTVHFLLAASLCTLVQPDCGCRVVKHAACMGMEFFVPDHSLPVFCDRCSVLRANQPTARLLSTAMVLHGEVRGALAAGPKSSSWGPARTLYGSTALRLYSDDLKALLRTAEAFAEGATYLKGLIEGGRKPPCDLGLYRRWTRAAGEHGLDLPAFRDAPAIERMRGESKIVRIYFYHFYLVHGETLYANREGWHPAYGYHQDRFRCECLRKDSWIVATIVRSWRVDDHDVLLAVFGDTPFLPKTKPVLRDEDDDADDPNDAWLEEANKVFSPQTCLPMVLKVHADLRADLVIEEGGATWF